MEERRKQELQFWRTLRESKKKGKGKERKARKGGGGEEGRNEGKGEKGFGDLCTFSFIQIRTA